MYQRFQCFWLFKTYNRIAILYKKMSSIITITLNPSVDKSTTVPLLLDEKKMYCSGINCEPGGGGINVARALGRLGEKSLAIYFAGGYHGEMLTRLLKKENVPALPITIQENTRENWIIHEETKKKQYRFVMPGPVIQPTEWEQLFNIISNIHDLSFLVISGSMPPSVPDNFYEKMKAISLEKNAKLAIDTSGNALKQFLEYGVYMIKPSKNELSSLVKLLNINTDSLMLSAKELVLRGYCEVVIVSLGEEGALLVSNNIMKHLKAPLVNRKSTVGAGDCMVAGILYKLLNKQPMFDAVEYGIACGAAATLNPGTNLFSVEDVEQLYMRMFTTVQSGE